MKPETQDERIPWELGSPGRGEQAIGIPETDRPPNPQNTVPWRAEAVEDSPPRIRLTKEQMDRWYELVMEAWATFASETLQRFEEGDRSNGE